MAKSYYFLPAGEASRKRPVSFAGTVQLELEEAA